MAGAAIGSTIFPGVGTVIGGLIGSLAGGIASYKAAKTISDAIVEDDVVRMQKILEDVLVNVGEDYMLSESEFKILIERLVNKIKRQKDWMGNMVKSYRQQGYKGAYNFAYKDCAKISSEIIKHRQRIKVPTGDEILAVLET